MKWLRDHKFRRVDMQLAFCVAVLAGIGAAHAGLRASILEIAVFVASSVFLIWKRRLLGLVVLVVFGVLLGLHRGNIYRQHLDDYQNLSDQKLTLIGTATADGVYGTNSQIAFTAQGARLAGGQKLAGTIYVSGFGLNAVFQGDEVEITGKLRMGTGQYQGFMSYTQLSLIAHHPSFIADIRRKFAAGMQTSLPEPNASFAMGLLVGQRSTLPADVKQNLLAVGLTHIIAVSGYNLTIMLHAARRLMGKHSKRISTLLSLGLIAVFLLITGSSASIVRAAIVSGLSIWAGYYGRSFRPINLILIAAAVTAYANPFYIWSDVSWYLSFLAFYGVLVIAPLVASRFRHAWQKSILAGVALESICAEMMTVPIVVYVFGQISLIGLPANVLVVALIPLAMLLSFIAGIAGTWLMPIAGWLAWPANVLLTYMLDTAKLLANIPGVFQQKIGLSSAQMITLYALVPILTLVLTNRAKAAKITDKNQANIQGEMDVRTLQMVDN